MKKLSTILGIILIITFIGQQIYIIYEVNNYIYRVNDNEDYIIKICKDNNRLDSFNKELSKRKIDTIYQYFQVYTPTIPNNIDSVSNFVKSKFSVFYWGKYTDTVRLKHYKNFCDL